LQGNPDTPTGIEDVFDLCIRKLRTRVNMDCCVTQLVLLPNMLPGAEFHFERTRNQDVPYVPLKPLSKIYAKYPEEYNESNTTIVDDNVETFRDNRANAVHVPPFFYDKLGGSPETRLKNVTKDRGLYTIIEVLMARKKRVEL
jgi:hypothetical protein